MSAGVIILGTDERKPLAYKRKPMRVALIGEWPASFERTDWVFDALERDSFRNGSALYLGAGRWGLWLYWRRLPQGEKRLSFRDMRKIHALERGTVIDK